VIIVLGLARAGPVSAVGPSEVWVSGTAESNEPKMPRGTTVIYEFFAHLGVQEGLVLGEAAGSLRAPLGVKPLFGFNFLELGSTRILFGATLSVPFSVEMGFGHDLAQFAVAPGAALSRRECANWGWFAGLEVPVVVTPERREGAKAEVLVGVTARGGAAWYFLTGFGVYGEASLDVYFGPQTAAAIGVTAGLVLSYEMFRFKPAAVEPAGGRS
jgi:hypothetical protein